MVAVADLDAILLDLDGTILDTTEELCHAVATAANQMRETHGDNNILPSMPALHHTDILTKYPGLFGGPLEGDLSLSAFCDLSTVFYLIYDLICSVLLIHLREEFHDTLIGPHLSWNSNNNKNSRTDDDDKRHTESTKTFIRLFLQAVKEQAAPCPAFPDVLGGLECLAQKYPSLLFGIATTKPTVVAEADLVSPAVPAKLRPLIHHVQGTDPPDIRPKPKPDVLLHCARALKRHSGSSVDITRTIYIGDTSRDAQAARAAGCAACLTVCRPKKGEEGGDNDDNDQDALGADGFIHTFGEIEAVLETILNHK